VVRDQGAMRLWAVFWARAIKAAWAAGRESMGTGGGGVLAFEDGLSLEILADELSRWRATACEARGADCVSRDSDLPSLRAACVTESKWASYTFLPDSFATHAGARLPLVPVTLEGPGLRGRGRGTALTLMGEAGLMGAAALGGGVGVGIAFPLPFWDAVMRGGALDGHSIDWDQGPV
jgi:hypothetical protein